jgi:hypothetical protein
MPEDQDATYDFMDFEINFTDLTLLEANGEYEQTKIIMEKPQKLIGNIYAQIPSKQWVVKSKVTIQHALGFSAMICDFYDSGRIIITDFMPSIKDVHTPDLRCLSYWAQKSGWQVPEPKPSLAEEWMDFWRRQWETYIVNSSYLDHKWGERKPIIFGDEADNDDEEDGLEEEIKKL